MSENKLFVMDQEADTCTVKTQALPWTSKEIPDGWKMQVFAAHGMEAYTFHVEPGASWPAHKGPDKWAGLMLEGQMILEISEQDGAPVETLECNEGDGFSFAPDVMHAWRNAGAVSARMSFTRIPE